MSNLLISEPPLQLLPGLAVRFGLNEAIFLQQLHYWLNNAKVAGKIVDGRKWISNSVKQWRSDNFPFWSEDTIQRAIKSLIQQGAVSARKDLNSGAFDRTNWYTINYDVLDREPQLAVTREPQVAAMDGRELPASLYTETTKAETTAETTKARARVDHSPVAPNAAPTAFAASLPLSPSAAKEFIETTNVTANAPPPVADGSPGRIVAEDPPGGPRASPVHRHVTRPRPRAAAIVDSPHVDGRKFANDGRIKAGRGTTAIEIYYERQPVKNDKDTLSAPVEDDLIGEITDLHKWRSVVRAWQEHGYNMKNITGMRDWYRDGIPQKGAYSGNNNPGRSNGQNPAPAFAQQPGQKRYDPRDPTTWDREVLATFDPDTLAAIECAEREGRVYSM